MKYIPTLITIGDPAGIGPEIVVKSFCANSKLFNICQPVVIGDFSILKKYLIKHKVKFTAHVEFNLNNLQPQTLNIIDLKLIQTILPGKPNKNSAVAAIKYIDYAVWLIKQYNTVFNCLITGPVSKEIIIKSGIDFAGHTEYLANLTKTKKVAMVMHANKCNVLLATRHIPLKDVVKTLNSQLLIEQILTAYKSLIKYFKLKKLKIFICGVNPHCGNGGLIGCEEKVIIEPVMKKLLNIGLNVSGPFNTAVLFNSSHINKHSLVVCHYHDQAMLPLKIIFGNKVVNLTCGLPFVRTSPAHGPAFDIAGKNCADTTSMIEAINLACQILKSNQQL